MRNKQLALDLQCAAIAYQMGITFSHCQKRYMQDVEPSEFWMQMSDVVTEMQKYQYDQADSQKTRQASR